MNGRISRVFINELLMRTNIISLISKRIKLKKQGKNFYAYCPFHYENNPSFSVNEEKQFYYCFGCCAHGNVIDFLMNYDQLDFIESIEELALQQGLKIIYEECYEQNHQKQYCRQNLFNLMDKISFFYQKTLKEKNSVLAQQYLHKRGLNESTIEYFSIGFSPQNWNSIVKKFGSSKEERTLLEATGMLISNDYGQVYDRFRKRIMFPIRNIHGRVIAFGGRILDEGYPKYLNSPETEIFHKSRQIYGLYEAKRKCQKISKLLIVEGYMDVITLNQFGIDNVVASLGTSFPACYIQLLYRVTEHLVFCYDGDRPGREAAWRTMHNALPYLIDGRQLNFIFLPEGEDPDSLIRKIGKEAFKLLIHKALPLSIFLFENLISEVNLSNLDGRVKLGTLALPLINQIPSQILRIQLRQQLGIKIGILDDNQLEKLTFRKKINTSPLLKIKYTTMRILIALLIQHPKLSILVTITEDLCSANLPGIELFIKLVLICKKQPELTTGQLLEYFRDNKFYHQLEILAIWNHMISDASIEDTFNDILTSVKNKILEQRQEILIARDRINGLTIKERKELWLLNQTLAKKK